MTRRPRKIDRSRVTPVAARRAVRKVKLADEARPHRAGDSLASFLDALPQQLGAADLRAVIEAWAKATQRGKTVLFGFGAHLVKVGLSPLITDLLERGAIDALVMNGAGCVHDLELALLGRTSEDVGPALDEGTFGMTGETTDRLNEAINRGARDSMGMGAALGREIAEGRYPHAGRSVLATAYRLGVPVTVHVAIGSDIHHMHPGADGAALGQTSYQDFETLAGLVATLEGGVFFNVGSAVILPEVFLKALALARNLGHRVRRLTTVNVDFIRHYRPSVNVVDRPTRQGGRGISLIGHHEILIPLLAAGWIEAQAQQTDAPKRRNPRNARRGKGQ